MPALVQDCFDALGEDPDEWITMTRSTRSTRPGSPTARTSTSSPTPSRWRRRSRSSAGPTRPPATCATSTSSPSCTGSRCATSSTATSTPPPPWPPARWRGWSRPAGCAASRRPSAVPAGRPAAPDLLVPVPLRRRRPQRALAIYAVIAYMDSVEGVFFPRGGMHAIPPAMAAAAAAHGVDIRCCTEVARDRALRRPGDRRRHRRRRAVRLRRPRPQLRPPGRLPRPARRPAAARPGVLAVVLRDARRRRGVPRRTGRPVHHTISFGPAWRGDLRRARPPAA